MGNRYRLGAKVQVGDELSLRTNMYMSCGTGRYTEWWLWGKVDAVCSWLYRAAFYGCDAI